MGRYNICKLPVKRLFYIHCIVKNDITIKSIAAFVLLTSFFACLGLNAHANAFVPDTGRINKSLDTLKIVYLGSSVPSGTGASKNFGYTSMYSQLLKKRDANGIGKPWTTVNKSIGGDNTERIMARWQRDLVPQKAKYVVIALSLGNEGIHEFGKPKFEQFKTNMTKMISIARDSGYVPVIANCYTRNDFNEADYNYVKQLNLWINALNVPSINLLGAVDDGTGKWATNYWSDGAHPNDAGHAEMSYAIVPSLFDALANGKSQPKFIDASYLNWDKKQHKLLHFKPDNALHAFTTAITIKTDVKGQVLKLTESTGNTINISINSKGLLEYKSAKAQTIKGITKIDDGKWHKIILTHYYARGETILYCDSIQQGNTSEKLSIQDLYLGDTKGKGVMAKDWLFYRSGMNLSEVKALSDNTFLKSSLELYAPLDGLHRLLKNGLSNLAQSTNAIEWAK